MPCDGLRPAERTNSCPAPQSCVLRVEAGYVLKRLDFEAQRVVDFRRTRSLSDGGRSGFGAEVSQAFSKRLRPSPQTSHGRNGTARGLCMSPAFRLTKGAYTKCERVCQLGDKATPALVWKAGVEFENDVCEELSPLAVQHRIRSRVPEQIGCLAGELVYRSVYPIIRRDPEGVQEKASPAPGVIVSSSSGRHIGVDQGCGVHHAVDAGGGGIVSIYIGRCLMLAVSSTTDYGGQEENSHGKRYSSHR